MTERGESGKSGGQGSAEFVPLQCADRQPDSFSDESKAASKTILKSWLAADESQIACVNLENLTCPGELPAQSQIHLQQQQKLRLRQFFRSHEPKFAVGLGVDHLIGYIIITSRHSALNIPYLPPARMECLPHRGPNTQPPSSKRREWHLSFVAWSLVVNECLCGSTWRILLAKSNPAAIHAHRPS